MSKAKVQAAAVKLTAKLIEMDIDFSYAWVSWVPLVRIATDEFGAITIGINDIHFEDLEEHFDIDDDAAFDEVFNQEL